MPANIKDITDIVKRVSSQIEKSVAIKHKLKACIECCSEHATRLSDLYNNYVERSSEIKPKMEKSISRHHAKLAKKMIKHAKKANSACECLMKMLTKTIHCLEELRSNISPADAIDLVKNAEDYILDNEKKLSELAKKIQKEMLDMKNQISTNETTLISPGLSNSLIKDIQNRSGTMMKTIEETDTSLNALRTRLVDFSDQILRNDAEILKELRKEDTYSIDIDSTFRKFGARPEKSIVLIDSSFILDVERERNAQGKTYYDVDIPADEVIIPKEVSKEIRKGKSFINYLRTKSNLDFGKKISRDSQIDTRIRLAWENTTKGRSATEHEKNKFVSSGDAAILHEAFDTIRNKKADRVIILAHDNDINGVVKEWRRNQIIKNITVFMLNRGNLVPHT